MSWGAEKVAGISKAFFKVNVLSRQARFRQTKARQAYAYLFAYLNSFRLRRAYLRMPVSKAKALGASLGKFAPRVLVRRKKNTLFGKGLRKAAHLIVISPKTRFFGSVPVPGGPFLGIYVPKIVGSSGSCSFYC